MKHNHYAQMYFEKQSTKIFIYCEYSDKLQIFLMQRNYLSMKTFFFQDTVHSQDNGDHAFDMNAEHEPIPEADNDNDDMPDMVGDFPDNDYAGSVVYTFDKHTVL